MNASPNPPEHSPAEERDELIAHLYAMLASRLIEFQVHESRQVSAREARSEWRRIWQQLDERVVAPDELLDQLATMAYVARCGHSLRVLIVGVPGAGKSHVAAALASLVSDHVVTLDATVITESGWSGLSLQEALSAAGGPGRLTGATIVIEEFDKIRISRQAHGNALDKYRHQQALWLSLLDRAGTVPLGAGSLCSAGVHVIMTGAFADAAWARAVGAAGIPREVLTSYGLLPELVDRIDHVVALTAPAATELARILRHEIELPRRTALEEAVVEMGYSLRIEPSVYPYVARSLRHKTTAGTRVGRAVIEAAIQHVLATAIQEELPTGTVLRITPDDVRLPPPPEEEPPRSRGGPGQRPVRRR